VIVIYICDKQLNKKMDNKQLDYSGAERTYCLSLIHCKPSAGNGILSFRMQYILI